MKFTLDVENKTIQIHGSFTQKDLSEIFNVLNIKNIDEYIIEATKLSVTVLVTITYLKWNTYL